ncbi:Co-chaperone protein DjlA [Thalassocella blandensis]|nr:Co-chaperone protein DjlA [Thalassocella blandensis]
MQYIGRLLVTIIGAVTLGPIGAILGFLIGMVFDKGRMSVEQGFNPQDRARIETLFFQTVFPLLGKLAKADGRVSEEEISGAEQLMTKMGLSHEQRQHAIALFKEGVDPEYDIEPVLAQFVSECARYNNLKQLLLVYLITIAYADGSLHAEEEGLLQVVADKLGYSRIAFNHLLGMIKAQTYFYRGQQDQSGYRSGGYQNHRPLKQDELKLAYEALGVEGDIGDKELKRAYRKLMSEYHPDKLAGRGVPEDMVKLATERSQEIQSAYDLIKKSRNL